MNKFTRFSAAGLIALAIAEGFSALPYKDTAGVVGNGFGNTQINPDKPVTVPQALADLDANSRIAQAGVRSCITTDVTQGQFDAYTSIAYNIGTSAFCKSSIAHYANEGNKQASCDSIMKFVYVAKKDCRIQANNCYGIFKRRESERSICLS